MRGEHGASAGRTAMLIAFALHNAEEIAFLGHGTTPDPRLLARLGLTEEDYGADRMSIAAALLSAMVTFATHPRAGRVRFPITPAISIAAAGALTVNAGGHLLLALVRRRYNPGLATAPLLLTSAVAAIRDLRADPAISRVGVGVSIMAGTVISVPAIVASLRVARLLSHVPTQFRKARSL